MSRRPLLSCLVACLLPLACAQGGESARRVPLRVFAASSLTEAFGEVELAFERANPNVDVQTSFAGSQVLRLQLEQGAQADVFASANAAHLDALEAAGLVSQAQRFAANDLVVVVPHADATHLRSFEDLARAERIVIGTAEVPVGAYTRQVLARTADRFGEQFRSDVHDRIVSEESNSRLVRAKVELGEADAAFVYRTDARGADQVRVIEIPEDLNVRAVYRMGTTRASAQPELAARFVDFVGSPEGRALLEAEDFSTEAP